MIRQPMPRSGRSGKTQPRAAYLLSKARPLNDEAGQSRLFLERCGEHEAGERGFWAARLLRYPELHLWGSEIPIFVVAASPLESVRNGIRNWVPKPNVFGKGRLSSVERIRGAKTRLHEPVRQQSAHPGFAENSRWLAATSSIHPVLSVGKTRAGVEARRVLPPTWPAGP
jgi:hypothetical protein